MEDSGAAVLEQALRQPKRPGGPALVPFLTAGYPRKEGFAELLLRVAEVADAVEIGVPFSDPMADGVTIQDTSRIALEQGVSLRWIFELLAGLPRRPAAPILLMSYLNPLFVRGLAQVAADMQAAGVSGLIVPDLPHEEAAPLRDPLEAHGRALIQLVCPLTDGPRLSRLCGASRGFVYAVTQTGTTGGALQTDPLDAYLARVKACAPVPVCAGFGIARPEQVDALRGHADGVIVGSALLQAIAGGDDPVAFLRHLMGDSPSQGEDS